MQLTCPHCRHVVDFSDERPRFCSQCGQSLLPSSPSPDDVLTITAVPLIDERTRDFPPGAETVPPLNGRSIPAKVPESIGGYRLLQLLGSGGMGSVYEGEHIASGQRAAVKLINADALSPKAVERFRMEGRLASVIAHPRCVFVLAADEEAGQPYIVMELMPGKTLADLVAERGPLPPDEAIKRIFDVIDGLGEAHRLGVIHRDVKPTNCFIDADDRVKIGDFGLAKSQSDGGGLTRTGSFVGTVLFASPEQIKRLPLDTQTDVYSASATLYYLLTGKAPFDDVDALAATARIVTEDPPSMRVLQPQLSDALDRVVLRGLEREKSKRWADVEDFKNALKPLLPGQLSPGGLGYRFGAALIDTMVIFVFFVALHLTLIGPRMPDSLDRVRNAEIIRIHLLDLSISFIVWLLYLGVPEAICGRSIGKWTFRLNVRAANGIDRPGLGLGLLRIAAFYVIWHADKFLMLPILALTQMSDLNPWTLSFALIAAALLGQLLSFVLPLVTMRKRNGYRGLHEFLSGTRVVQLPEPISNRTLTRVSFKPPTCEPDGLPDRVGPFDICGAWRWGEMEKTMVGEDSSLGRKVLIWQRPATEPPLSPKRRELARPTRMRWVASGVESNTQWDAFLAPVGTPLPEAIGQLGRLSWAETQPVLDRLARELAAACRDGTLPKRLSPSHVWVDGEGRMQLVGTAMYDPDGLETLPEEDWSVRESSLALLADTAALMLEGRPRQAGECAPIQAPLPKYASAALNRLWCIGPPFKSITEFRNELRDKVPDVTRRRRLIHLSVLSALLFVAFSPFVVFSLFGPVNAYFFTIFAVEQSQRQLEQVHAVDLAVGAVQPDGESRLIALAQSAEDAELERKLQLRLTEMRRRLDEHQRWNNPLLRRFVRQQVELQRMQTERLNVETPNYSPMAARGQARNFLNFNVLDLEEGMFRISMGYFLVMAMIWVLWAFITRGGLSFRFSGIDLVRSDGRRAARWQCLVRALLFWVPLHFCIVTSAWLDMNFWLHWSQTSEPSQTWMPITAWALSLLAGGLLIAYFARALWNPNRSLHDRLAGTWLVPR